MSGQMRDSHSNYDHRISYTDSTSDNPNQNNTEHMIHKTKKQIRAEFRDAVFGRDGHRCVICEREAVDAHHIIDRSLWPDGGYYLDNGVSLCDEHHCAAEEGAISCEELRKMAEITRVLLPLGFDSAKSYNKWGNEIQGVVCHLK